VISEEGAVYPMRQSKSYILQHV